ncbi:MAG: 3'-5' exonuclease [Candidatus Doudnabacteria bacterium]|nr:3'-5' exonuclease [Candidatus Doudnabacteria bacterium]
MNFKKDILLIDLEMTGLDVSKHEIIQLSAVLLDKKSLEEKAYFNAYAKSRRWKDRDLESMRVNGVKKEWLDASPDLVSVLREFSLKFNPRDVILSYYGGPLDMDFLRAAYGKHKIQWLFDYHYFNLWSFFYGYLAAVNQLKNTRKFTGFSLEDLMRKYKVKSVNRHDGLEDCRVEAEILRKIIKHT